MKKMLVILAAATLTTSALPAFAQIDTSQKDECLLAAKNCTNQVDDIYRRMHKLDKEIRKGQKVYTPQELRALQQKLSETQEMLKDLERPGK